MDEIDAFLHSIEPDVAAVSDTAREASSNVTANITRSSSSNDDNATDGSKRAGETTAIAEGVLQPPHKRQKTASHSSTNDEKSGRIVESEVIVSAAIRNPSSSVTTTTSSASNPLPPAKAVVVDSNDYYASLMAPLASFPSSNASAKFKVTTSSHHHPHHMEEEDEISTTRSTSSSNTDGMGKPRAPIAVKREGGGKVWVDRTLGKYTSDYNLFVGNLAPDIKEDQVRSVFSEYPSLSFVRIVTDAKTGKGKGYAFVGFKDPFEMLKALREKQEKLCGARPMQISKSKFSAASYKQQHGNDDNNKAS